MLISRLDCEIWLNFSYWGVTSVIKCINLTYIPTAVVVAVVVDGLSSKNLGFCPPRQSWLVLALICR